MRLSIQDARARPGRSSEFSDRQDMNVSLVSDETVHWCNISELRLHWESAVAREYKIRVKLHATGVSALPRLATSVR